MEKIKSLPEDKKIMLSNWKSSGKSIKRYCIDENLPYHMFSYWHRKEKHLKSGKDKKFIKVKIKTALPISANKTEVLMHNGIRIIFHRELAMHELKQLAQ